MLFEVDKVEGQLAGWRDSEMNLERAVELLKRADSESKIAGLRPAACGGHQ
jgi:hypothetical protein